MFSGISIPVQQRTLSLEGVFVLVGAIAVASFVLVPVAGLAVVGGCVALWFLVLVGEAFRGKIDGILLWWAAALPLGPYFLSFPREQSIVTLDRVAILFAFAGLYFGKHSTIVKMPRTLRHAGLAWLAHHFTVRCSSPAPYATYGRVHLLNHLRSRGGRRNRHSAGFAPQWKFCNVLCGRHPSAKRAIFLQ